MKSLITSVIVDTPFNYKKLAVCSLFELSNSLQRFFITSNTIAVRICRHCFRQCGPLKAKHVLEHGLMSLIDCLQSWMRFMFRCRGKTFNLAPSKTRLGNSGRIIQQPGGLL